MVKHCYIHIPFCEHICAYCDFCKLFYKEELVDKYLEELDKEVTTLYQGETLETVYIGGGTPSSLNLKQLTKLFEIINKLKISDKAEVTIEGNFSNTTKEKLELFWKMGVNRLSFGLETTSKKQLKLLERTETEEKTREIIKTAKEIGFNNINVDLMYALPGEELADLKQDLEFINSLDIEHISCYSLIIEDHTKLAIKNIKNIDEDVDYEMYNYICKWMKDKGYEHYEISNYSKAGYQSRHNLGYWNNEEYYGFGLGASAFLGNKRCSNTRSITKYLKGNYISEEESLEKEDFVYYEIMLNLRKKEGINLKEISTKYNIKLEYKTLLDKELVLVKDNYIFIPEDKWYISNDIILALIEGVSYE